MKNIREKRNFLIALLTLTMIPALSFAIEEKNASANKVIHPIVTQQIFKKAKKNKNWKSAFVTGKHGQVVFMNITPSTNPKNEIGMETHPFDQIIFIVEGHGEAVLSGESSKVKSGDMIFIPEGTPHNVINLNHKKALKILSIYSNTDIPAGSTYEKKEDEPKS